MNKRVAIQVENDLAELERVSRLVDAFGAQHDLPRRVVFELNLVLDEVLTNVMSYGYADTRQHQIIVRLSVMLEPHPAEVVIEVEDDGRPFDPTEAEVPALDSPVEERPVGGLGIHLVRQLMDGLTYRRQQGKNVLLLRRVIDDRRRL